MHSATCARWSREMKLKVAGKTGAFHMANMLAKASSARLICCLRQEPHACFQKTLIGDECWYFVHFIRKHLNFEHLIHALYASLTVTALWRCGTCVQRPRGNCTPDRKQFP
mgnify:CR=1 FL=1